jgi:polyferredoxin
VNSAVELPTVGHQKQSAGTARDSGQMVDQPRGFDLFRLPGVRRFVRWRYARLVFQVPLLLLAAFVIVDGLTGRQIAPRNVATTAVWLHYRGLLVIGLAVIGNAFCAACPLMLTRGPSRWLAGLLPRRLTWPRALRSKWLVLGLLGAFFISYELFDFWASPWLTAWLALGYFAAALLVDVVFPAGTFCRYVCPLGNFNFALASVSPTQITAVDADVCRTCVEKPCLHGRHSGTAPTPGADTAFIPLSSIVNPNGAGRFPGCETDLFVPTITSNMDCTLCLNCVRACPYDNVALTVRSPGRELAHAPWLKRGRLAVMVMSVLLTFWGVMNALAMITPFYAFAESLSGVLGTRNEAALLVILYAGISLVGLVVTLGIALAADAAGGVTARPRRAFERWGYVVVALGFGFWGAHYLFHFLTGALAIVPVFQHFFELRGFAVDANWSLAQVVPSRWLFGIQATITAAAAAVALATAWNIARRDFGRRGVLAMWPMLLLVLAFTAMQLLILAQPMEMRGTVLGPSF